MLSRSMMFFICLTQNFQFFLRFEIRVLVDSFVIVAVVSSQSTLPLSFCDIFILTPHDVYSVYLTF